MTIFKCIRKLKADFRTNPMQWRLVTANLQIYYITYYTICQVFFLFVAYDNIVPDAVNSEQIIITNGRHALFEFARKLNTAFIHSDRL